jgi:hypothetical protein
VASQLKPRHQHQVLKSLHLRPQPQRKPLLQLPKVRPQRKPLLQLPKVQPRRKLLLQRKLQLQLLKAQLQQKPSSTELTGY